MPCYRIANVAMFFDFLTTRTKVKLITDFDGLKCPLRSLSQVALNDTIMVFAFAPIVGLLLGLSSIVVPWNTLIVSVVLYIIVPVILAQLWRYWLLKRHGMATLHRTLAVLNPLSIGALVLLFEFQGKAIVEQPLIILMLAVPITIQVYFNSALAYWLNRRLREAHCVAGPSALIGASNWRSPQPSASSASSLARHWPQWWAC